MKRQKSLSLPQDGYIVNIYYTMSNVDGCFQAIQNYHGSRFEYIKIKDIDLLKIVTDVNDLDLEQTYE